MVQSNELTLDYLFNHFFLKALMLYQNTPLKIQGSIPNHKLLLFLETQHYDTNLAQTKILKRSPPYTQTYELESVNRL